MSALLEQFKDAVRRKDWKTAYRHCNGLNMYEMLRGLDSIDRNDLETLSKGIFAEYESGSTNTPRIAYAINVVMNGVLPEIAPGDLAATGQVTDAKNFLAERKSGASKIKGPHLGNDGAIPPIYIGKLRQVFERARELNNKKVFTEKFQSVVQRTTHQQTASNVYETALNNMILHLADTAKNPKAFAPFTEDNELLANGTIDAVGWAYTYAGEPNTWIRQSSLEKDVNTIVAIILHEAIHTVGVSAQFENLIDEVHKAAGYLRPKVK